MSTYRERREARAERLRGWSESNAAKAAGRLEAGQLALDAIPFGQPILVGHHSERRDRNYRSRAVGNIDKGLELARRAESQASRAASIEAQAAHAIYSDDADAVERLAERIAGLEAERTRIKAFNASCRKGAPDLELLRGKEREWMRRGLGFRPDGSFASYHLSNLSGQISSKRARLAQLKRRAAS